MNRILDVTLPPVVATRPVEVVETGLITPPPWDRVSFARLNYGRTFRSDSCVIDRTYRFNSITHVIGAVWQYLYAI